MKDKIAEANSYGVPPANIWEEPLKVVVIILFFKKEIKVIRKIKRESVCYLYSVKFLVEY